MKGADEINRDYIFDVIGQYEKLKSERVTIVLKRKDDKDYKGFEILMSNGFSSLEKDEYFVSKWVLRKLDRAKIKYKVIN